MDRQGTGDRGVRQLTPNEVVFVGGESATVHQHTAGLMLLDAADRPGFGFEDFRKHMESRLEQVPHMRWRLHEVPFGLDLPYWVEAEDFDFDNHLRRVAVPSPGDREALGELVAYLYSRHLDRRRPLWEAWFIEGLPDGRFAVLTKIHHSMMDGEGAMKLGEIMCDLEPGGQVHEIDQTIADAQAGQVPSLWHESTTAAVRLAGLPLRVGRELFDGARRIVTHRITGAGEGQSHEPVPVASFNDAIGTQRGYLFGSVPFEDLKRIHSHFGVTINDAILAVISGSLRDYLLARGDLPDTSLRTSIAVSLRTASDDDFSNHVTTAGVTLATSLPDPVDRLRAIAEDCALAKEQAHHGGKGYLEMMGIFPPGLVGLALSMAPPDMVIRAAGFNLIVSNIRGSPLPLYIGGARITAIHPMSIIMPGGGLNVTCMSYAGEVDFGFTIDPPLLPDPWPLVDGLQDALDAYLDLIPDGAAG